ncbi:MAG: hypothetical protein AAF382_09295 [Pseudomonadota bacterium]
MTDARVACRTPSKGRDGASNIPRWKFDAVRAAILSSLEDGPMTIHAVKDAVRRRMSDEDLSKLGSVLWHVMTVKLELEVRGEIARIEGSKPQQICLSEG